MEAAAEPGARLARSGGHRYVRGSWPGPEPGRRTVGRDCTERRLELGARTGIIAKDGGERPRDLFILGLGKLGGEDLNYSSDIDLVAFFESEPFAVGPMQGKTEVAGKILKQVTKTLTRAGWRVDWRLRPAPSITPLAITTDAAFNYYFFHFDPWERLAFAKARPVAGDVVAARGS